MPRHTTIGGKKGRDTRRTNRYNLFCVFIREWVARGDANGGSATTMSRIASPYWEVLTDEERAYWRRRAREIYRPTPQDIANAGARGHRFGLTEHDGGGSAVVRLIEFGTPSREHFREWYSELTQSGMLDVISDDLVSTTAFVRGLKRSRSTRRWQDDVHLCSASQPVEPREASPSDLDTHSSLPTSFPSASWPAPTSGIHGDPPIVAPAGFDGHGDPWRPSFVPYLTPPSIVSPSPSELPWPAFIAHDFATVDHYREGGIDSPAYEPGGFPQYQSNFLELHGLTDSMVRNPEPSDWTGGEGRFREAQIRTVRGLLAHETCEGHPDGW